MRNNNTIVILTALAVEYEAVKAELVCVRTFRHDSGTLFEEGFVRGMSWRIVLAAAGRGSDSAAVIAERAGEMFRPRALVFVGIAGSLKPDVKIGHVVVATWVHAYQGGRQTEDGLLARPESWKADNGLLEAARIALGSHLGTFHFEPVAAGDVVLDAAADDPLRQRLRKNYNNAVAIEMEGAGVANAAHLAGGRPALVIRGISDLADGRKGAADAGGSQQTAARNATRAALAMLRVLAKELDRWSYCVSYVPCDRRWAEWIAWELRTAEGPTCRVLLAPCPGTESAYRAFPLWNGVARADRILAVVSDEYARSAHRRDEWQVAKQADAQALVSKVIPVRTDDREPPPELGLVRTVDLRDLAVEEARDMLLAGVREAGAGAPTAWLDGGVRPAAEPPKDDEPSPYPGFPGKSQAAIVRRPESVPEPLTAPTPVRVRRSGVLPRGTAVLADWLRGGSERRMRRAADRVAATLDFSTLSAVELDRAARYYRQALRLALRRAPAEADRLFDTYDRRIPNAYYAGAFRPQDEPWLAAFAAGGDDDTATVLIKLAGRLRLSSLQQLARGVLIRNLARSYDAESLVWHFAHWRVWGLLEDGSWGWALQEHAARVPLERHPRLWTEFLGELPEDLLPKMFGVHLLLGRGADAAVLAGTREEQRRALDCCLTLCDERGLREGLGLARALGDDPATRELQQRLGDLLFRAGRYREALPHLQDTGLLKQAGECHERLGRPFEALVNCPDDEPDRLLGLVDACLLPLGDLVARKRYADAARHLHQLGDAVRRLTVRTSAAATCQEDLAARRDAVLKEARNAFERRVPDEAENDRTKALLDWSEFEEAAGELSEAARLAETAGALYRAHELYRRAARYGEADRVLHGDMTDRGMKARAAALTAGGDLPRAAQVREEAGDWEEAIALLVGEKDLAGAVRCLRRKLGDEALEQDARLAMWLRATGEIEELARLCLAAVERGAGHRRAAAELRDLVSRPDLAPELVTRMLDALDALDAAARRDFEERVSVWIDQARRETDQRFASIWGLDLGTSQCAAAIYDTADRQPVACSWKGRDQFPSTLCVDLDGGELVGLTVEETQTREGVTLIRDSKRKMGTGFPYETPAALYRPEEVAAHLIRHARQTVEDFLAAHVRERVHELARAQLGHVAPEWLNWAEQQHNYRIARPKVIVTVPAHFSSKARSATRDACTIAGVRLVRFVHEPTAACVAVNFQRGGELEDTVIVVDLGAGTLDISHMDIGGGIHEVKRVFGDNACGSRDFDPLICRALTRQIEDRGLRVPQTVEAGRRLETAAEQIKINLSMQQKAEYLLRSFVDGMDVQVSLTREELADVVSEPLDALREFCARTRGRLPSELDHLVLIGGPMLSPLVSDLFQRAFGRTRTMPGDPRTAVSLGAALTAAQLDGKLAESLIVDVTPFAMGIRAHGQTKKDQFAVLIEPNSVIPTKRSEIFTTGEDNQDNVVIEIFSGVVSPDSRIGHFQLDGIRPAVRGGPRIKVSFDLDAGGVLKVSAHDLDTGHRKSIQVYDSTLLTPDQVARMTEHLRRFNERQRLLRERDAVRERLRRLLVAVEDGDTGAEWEEFRRLLETFCTPAELLDPATQEALATMHSEARLEEFEFIAARDAFRRLNEAARDLLDELSNGKVTVELVRGAQDFGTRLEHDHRELAERRAKLATWKAVLIRSEVSEQDILTRFRDRHDDGDFAGALEVLDGLSLRLDHTNDMERLLHCIAETEDLGTRAQRYRTTLRGFADRLLVCPLPPERPDECPPPIRSALVDVLTTGQDAVRTRRSGFLLADGLVVTTLLNPIAPDRITVCGEGFEATVAEIMPLGRESALVAILRLAAAAPYAFLRLGHPGLVRLGDPVWVPVVHGSASVDVSDRPGSLLTAAVDGLENVPERQLRLVRTTLRPTPEQAGAPLLNDLGEVIGLLCASDRASAARGGFAVSADALTPLLARMGRHRYR
ncbi:Hsp70 family protein [Streptomyces sp. NPDC005538]|uniref:Hsp70 family protein n=1 Tax=unclassified Streptomyces TaxID=2593676 RepID=UPI0033AB278D